MEITMSTAAHGVCVTCYVQPLSALYQDGLERVELFVSAEHRHLVPVPPVGQRVPVILATTAGQFRGGLRAFDGRSYLCPDLADERNNEAVSLARVLSRLNIQPKQHVQVKVEEHRWTIL